MKSVSTDKSPAAAGPYSQAIVCGNLVYVSGQIAADPETGIVSGDISEQARRALENLRNIIEESGSSMKKVLKVTVYLSSISDFPAVNKVYAEFFSEPYPARSCVAVSGIPKGSCLEIDAVAYLRRYCITDLVSISFPTTASLTKRL